MKRNIAIALTCLSLIPTLISSVITIRAINSISYYSPEENELLDPQWLLDAEYSKKDLGLAIKQFKLWNEYLENARTSNKYLSTVAIASNGIKTPGSICSSLSINECLYKFAQGQEKESKSANEEELYTIMWKIESILNLNPVSGQGVNEQKLRLHIQSSVRLLEAINKNELEGLSDESGEWHSK